MNLWNTSIGNKSDEHLYKDSIAWSTDKAKMKGKDIVLKQKSEHN